MSKSIKLFVVSHKDVNTIPYDRVLIGVGNNRNIKNVYCYDNTLINIADKNDNYCELTALYWMWKNTENDYEGLEHYRRFFCSKNIFCSKPLSLEFIESKLNKYDAIIPKKARSKQTVYEYYAYAHYKSDLDVCIDIINEKYPEYVDDCKDALNARKACMTNMFIMSKKSLNKYCEWLFNILFEAEKRIDISGRDAYQTRVFGFLSERLFNIWLLHEKMNCYYAPIYDLNVSPIVLKFKGLLRRFKRLLKK